nr:MAG TPA: RNA dependent RNA polymerase [Caudoviricetes sp.]
MKNKEDIVALNDSQILRWIDEINRTTDSQLQIAKVKKQIKTIKTKEKSKENKIKIKELYKKLYNLQYQKDYFCLIIDNNKDYDRANKGFKVNGISYRRLLGTNGGIKKSTIVYINAEIYDEIKKRIDNGRDRTKELVPAKLEAYQALVCSGSIPVSMPRILVVQDCFTKFTDEVLRITDDESDEPKLTYIPKCEIEYCDSDGYGFMSPTYSALINKELGSSEFDGQTITGINSRFAWTKGMLFTFDFVEFAAQKNNGNYTVIDIWGMERDVRNYDVVLTGSMLKLWESYKSCEDYMSHCVTNNYQFSVAKTSPLKLENCRNANYQFLQTYELDDDELWELCEPTITEIKEVLGYDYRKSLVFLNGLYLNEDSVDYIDDNWIKALMIEKDLINDPFVLKKIYSMIRNRINMSAKGSIKLSGNFAIVSGDLYSLAQSMFGIQVTGLLKAGEIYHKYWIDKGSDEIVLFRAPMTCHNNIRKRKVVRNDDMDFWYQYVTTGVILNSWDTTCDATNGSDKDGDMFFTTDNPILLKHTLNSTTIQCVQKKANKVIPTEEHLINSNKQSFGDEIGITTNRVTAMIERQAMFSPISKEYEMLAYRIKCGQHLQQNAIDKTKGIISKPMPKYWYNKSACEGLPENTDDEISFKRLCEKIVVERKPYFMRYIYPDLNNRYMKYCRDTNSKCVREFQISVDELINKPNKTVKEKEFMSYYYKFMPVGTSNCIVNRIAWLFEKEFKNITKFKTDRTFNYTVLKSCVQYSGSDFKKIQEIKKQYDKMVALYQRMASKEHLEKIDISIDRLIMLNHIKAECEKICPNESELCDIVLDICYLTETSKQFAWDICGDTIIKNLLERNNYVISYPSLVTEHGDFEFGGEHFVIRTKNIEEGDIISLS